MDPQEPPLTDPEAFRKRYEALVHSVSDGVITLDAKGITTSVNAAGARALGHLASDLVGRPALDTFHRAHADGAPHSSDESPIFATLSDSTVHHVRGGEVFWRKDGKSIPVEYVSTPLRGAAGKVEGVLVTFHSTGDRDRNERALRESEERFRRLSEAALEGVIIHDNGKIIDANDAIAAMLGTTREALIATDLLDRIAPGSRAATQQRLRAGTDGIFSATALRLDGAQFDVEISGKSVPYEGRTARVAAIRQATPVDASNAKRVVELYERLPDAFFALDKDWRFTYLNPVALAMVPPQHRARRIGEDMWATFPDLKGTLFDTEYHRAMRDQVPVHVEEYFARMGLWFAADAHPTPEGLSIVFRDITAQKQADEAARTANVSRPLARKIVQELVEAGGVAHQTLQQVGRRLASENGASTDLDAFISAYREMGLGQVRLERREEGRFTFTGADLLERRPGSRVATCYFTLGYLSEAVSRVSGGEPTLGTEIECESRGAHECRFVVQVKKPEEGLARRVKELV